MLSNEENRYGLKAIHKIKPRKDGFKYGPEDAILNFIGEVDTGKRQYRHEFISHLQSIGTIINFTPSDLPSSYDMKSIVHSIFSLSEVIFEDSEYEEIPRKSMGTLLENLATGYFFIIYENDDVFVGMMVHDFSGSKENPKAIRIANQFQFIEDLWTKVAPDTPGTRMGGVPLNSDGSAYTGPWPYAEDGYFSFIGQYQLPDGRYIHQFANYNAENYDYSAMEDSNIDPYSVALVEGEPLPKGVVADNNGVKDIIYSDVAFMQKTCESVKKYPPVWIQGDATLRNTDFEFLIGFGDRQGPLDADEFRFGDMYLFWNPKTGIAHTLMQCS